MKINNVKIAKFADLKGQLTAKRPGESVNVTVNRNGNLLTKTVKLIEKVTRYISRALEMEFDDLSAKELKKYKLTGGAKIIKEENEYEDEEGFVGYIVTSVNGKSVSNADEAVKLIDGYASRGYRLSLKMINKEGEIVRYRITVKKYKNIHDKNPDFCRDFLLLKILTKTISGCKKKKYFCTKFKTQNNTTMSPLTNYENGSCFSSTK